MSKKKAVICTILFAIVFIAVLIGAYFIETYDGSVRLIYLVSAFVTGMWVSDCIEKFYKWLIG